jgi:hypothetical protein
LKIKHGKYIAFTSKGNIAINGLYENNQPKGIWYFNNNTKADKTDSLDYSFYSNLKKNFEANTDSIVLNPNADKEAEYPGGPKAWKRFLDNNLSEFDETDSEKEIVISFMIDKYGKLFNAYPVKSISPIIDLEIIKLIRKSPNWSPAIQNGKKVIVIFTQSITL